MPRDYKVFLQDAVDAIDNVAEFASGMSLDAFKADKKDPTRGGSQLGSCRRSS